MKERLKALGIQASEKRWRILLYIIIAIVIFIAGMQVQAAKQNAEQEHQTRHAITSLKVHMKSVSSSISRNNYDRFDFVTSAVPELQISIACLQQDILKCKNIQILPYFSQTNEYLYYLERYFRITDYHNEDEFHYFISPIYDMDVDDNLSVSENLRPLEDYFLTPEGESLIKSLMDITN